MTIMLVFGTVSNNEKASALYLVQKYSKSDIKQGRLRSCLYGGICPQLPFSNQMKAQSLRSKGKKWWRLDDQTLIGKSGK